MIEVGPGPFQRLIGPLTVYKLNLQRRSRCCNILWMKKLLFRAGILLAISLAFSFTGCKDRQQATQKPAAESPGAPSEQGDRMAPSFSLSDISGNIVSSSQLAGKPVVINFFATWCPPCREEVPGFVEIYRKYKSRGFELVGIALDTDKTTLPHFLSTNGIDYRILIGNTSTTRAFGGVNTIPATFFIDKDGRIRNVHVGYLDKDSFEKEVLKIL